MGAAYCNLTSQEAGQSPGLLSATGNIRKISEVSIEARAAIINAGSRATKCWRFSEMSEFNRWQGRRKACAGAAVHHFDCLSSDRRHRCSAARFDQRPSTESGKSGEVAWALSIVSQVLRLFAPSRFSDRNVGGLLARKGRKSGAKGGSWRAPAGEPSRAAPPRALASGESETAPFLRETLL